MNSFINIGAQKNASLDVVAPGIAEALIATAIGLAAAIPAVMAYNYFVRRINVLSSEMDSFSSDMLNIVRRHFLAG
jgi:biopolymer transport protein TolQ